MTGLGGVPPAVVSSENLTFLGSSDCARLGGTERAASAATSKDDFAATRRFFPWSGVANISSATAALAAETEVSVAPPMGSFIAALCCCPDDDHVRRAHGLITSFEVGSISGAIVSPNGF